MKHTAGPWKFYWRKEDGLANCGVYVEHREGHAVSVCRAPQYETRAQWEANARLIAAAPEMCALLRYWRDECSGAEPSLSVFNRSVDDLLAKVEAQRKKRQ